MLFDFDRFCSILFDFVRFRSISFDFVRFRSISFNFIRFRSLLAAMCYCRMFRAVSSIDRWLYSLWKSVMHVPLPTVVVRVECRGRDGSYLVGAREVDVHPRRPSVGDRVHQQGGAWKHTRNMIRCQYMPGASSNEHTN